MTESDFIFVPLSDVTLSDMHIVERHKELIESDKYSDAVSLLDSNDYQKGYRASLFNSMRNKLMLISTYLLNLTAESDEYYSLTEPDQVFMQENGKKYWIQPFE